MTPSLRKLSLTVHVSSSVAWIGAVAAFLALSIAGVASDDADTVRAAYVAMNLIGQFVIVPLGSAIEAQAGPLPDVGRLGPQLVGDAGFAVVVLLLITTIAIYKPWGRTPYGRRIASDRSEQRDQRPSQPRGLKIFVGVLALIILVFVVLHLTGRGLGGHSL